MYYFKVVDKKGVLAVHDYLAPASTHSERLNDAKAIFSQHGQIVRVESTSSKYLILYKNHNTERLHFHYADNDKDLATRKSMVIENPDQTFIRILTNPNK